MRYLLQVAGVNIYATVKDTNQLSVQRGSSLLLRKAMVDIDINHSELREISTGASTGLFEFEADNDDKALEIQDKIINELNIDKNYRHLSFVVDIVVIQENNLKKECAFKNAKEEVLALNRFRQFQQSTIVFPAKNNNLQIAPCAWDNLRPADGQESEIVTREKIEHGSAIISLSAEARHKFGRDQKREFLEQETGMKFEENEGFTYDLHEITTLDSNQSHLKSLDNKLAILYFDGNGFGGIQDELKHSCELKKFDKLIQDKRKEWLRKLIETIRTDKDFKIKVKRKNRPVDALRLEILLWGGDEIMLAVPAWKGMQVLQHFYQFHKNWQYKDKILTHAGGLVLCHVRTPIQRMQKLAQEIADHIKDAYLGNKEGMIDKYSPDANLYDYVVLESVDYPTQTWKTFLTKKHTHAITKQWKPQKPLEGDFQNYVKKLNYLKETLPRRQLYRLANTMINETEFAKAYNRFGNIVDNAEKLEEIAKQIFPDMERNLHWLHLLDLWDYFAPENDKQPKNKAIGVEANT